MTSSNKHVDSSQNANCITYAKVAYMCDIRWQHRGRLLNNQANEYCRSVYTSSGPQMNVLSNVEIDFPTHLSYDPQRDPLDPHDLRRCWACIHSYLPNFQVYNPFRMESNSFSKLLASISSPARYKRQQRRRFYRTASSSPDRGISVLCLWLSEHSVTRVQ